MIMRLKRFGIGFIRVSKQAVIYVLIFVPYLAGWIAGLVISLGRLWWAAFTQGYEDVAK